MWRRLEMGRNSGASRSTRTPERRDSTTSAAPTRPPAGCRAAAGSELDCVKSLYTTARRRNGSGQFGVSAVVGLALAFGSWALGDHGVAAPMSPELPECADQWLDRSFPPELEVKVPPQLHEQPRLRGVSLWDDSVVAMGSDLRAYRVDPEKGSLVPLAIAGCPEILDLQENAAALFALCSQDESKYLMTRSKRGSSVAACPRSFPGCRFFSEG